MKNNILVIILSLLILSAFINKADNKKLLAPPNKKDYLTASIWRIKEVIIKQENINESAVLDSEALGATFTFHKNGNYEIYSDGDTDTGTWFLTANENKLILDKGTEFEDVWTVLKLNPAMFNYSILGTTENNKNIKTEIRLIPK